MKRKPKLKPKEKIHRIRELEYKIKHLERELVSALEKHGKALVQRNHAEEMTQSIYNALRKLLGICRSIR